MPEINDFRAQSRTMQQIAECSQLMLVQVCVEECDDRFVGATRGHDRAKGRIMLEYRATSENTSPS